jgi:predicted PurR-regulated permease PerM
MNHPIILTFLIMAIVAAMSLAAEVLRPLALAVLLSFALEPIARFLERLKLPRPAAVVLTVVTALGALGAVGYVVGEQLAALARRLPAYEKNITEKISGLRSNHDTVLSRASKVASDVAATIDGSTLDPNVVDVRVVAQASMREQITSAAGPYIEKLGVGFLVLILVLFLLLNRSDLRDRIVQLCGRGHITLTTRTMDEVGQRISRYLAMLTAVNSTYGLIVGLGLWSIGVPYSVLWGFLAGALRFIPYAGPSTAFALPMLFSIAHFPVHRWQEPAEVVALFLVLEILANVAIEPIIYGKTTGVWALGLLVAAMFWTWLWGILGLLLSTPMTVCLAVLGKYVPSLRFFATMLGEESELSPDLRYYQRLLALDQDGATEIVEAALAQQPRIEVFEQIMLPALYRAQRDSTQDAIDDSEQAFIERVTSDLLDDLEVTPEAQPSEADVEPAEGPSISSNETVPDLPSASPTSPPPRFVGLASNGAADVLTLRMLNLVLRPSGLELELVDNTSTPLKIADRVAELKADVVVMSHLPPAGLTMARYLVRRLRARFPRMPILVVRSSKLGPTSPAERLLSAGASQVIFSLSEARDVLLSLGQPKAPNTPSPTLEPAAAASR